MKGVVQKVIHNLFIITTCNLLGHHYINSMKQSERFFEVIKVEVLAYASSFVSTKTKRGQHEQKERNRQVS
jgi:hypothetical protein